MSAFNDYFLGTLKNRYADFNGRARRSEYWYFVLFSLLVNLALYILTFVLGAMNETLAVIGFGLICIYALAVIIPTLAVGVRRLHDTDKTGWLYLLILIPIIGPIILLVFFVTEGTRGTNKYGADPKALPGSEVQDHLIERS